MLHGMVARQLLLGLALCALPNAGLAQRSLLPAPHQAIPQTPATGGRAFLIESAGGTAGSALGFGLIYLLGRDCDVEDLGCNLQNAFGAVAVGTAASAAGAYLAGRLGNTRPSGWGATVGSIAGAGGAIGLWHLLTEELDVVNDQGAVVVTYALTQGLMTALGSRIGRAITR